MFLMSVLALLFVVVVVSFFFFFFGGGGYICVIFRQYASLVVLGCNLYLKPKHLFYVGG